MSTYEIEVTRRMAARLADQWAHAVGEEMGFTMRTPEPDEHAAFLDEYQPVMLLRADDGGDVTMWGVKRLANVACGFAWDLGAAQAENERLRVDLKRVRGLLAGAYLDGED